MKAFRQRRLAKTRGVILLGLMALIIGAAIWVAFDYYRTLPEDRLPRYVGRQTCITCHELEGERFHGSDHDRAMDRATEATVLGRFDGTQVHHYGITSTLFRDGDRFMINTEGPDGQMHDYAIRYVFGVRPLQQYMVEFDRDGEAGEGIGRLQVLRICWDTERQRWFYLSPPDVDERIHPTDPLHWTGITQRWNTSCAECHSTNVQKNFDLRTATYHTTMSEIDVSCEACHGPGSLHVELAQRRRLFWDRRLGKGLVSLQEDSITQIETCAPCHSRRTKLCNGFQAGERFDDFFACRLLSRGVYHDDGQIRDEVYVYGSFLQSRMYRQDIRCTDCHDPHSGKVHFDDNRLCTSCHQHPAGKYDSPSHHFHTAGQPGSFCVDCHMPQTTYMQVDPRRDHSLRVPRPDLSVQFGTPNACTGCHLDADRLPESDRGGLRQYLDWIVAAESGNAAIRDELQRVDRAMRDAVQKWFPERSASSGSTWYADLALGKSDHPEAAETLRRMAVDPQVPAILRATAIDELAGDRTDVSLQVALQTLDDPDPKVVAAGLRRLDMEIARALDRFQYGRSSTQLQRQLGSLVERVMALTAHANRQVRIAAANVALGLPDDLRDRIATPAQRRAYRQAVEESIASLELENDRATTHVVLGSIYEMKGDPERAIREYRTAMRLDPNLVGPRSNLAALLERRVRRQQQELKSDGGAVPADRIPDWVEPMQRDLEEARTLRNEEHSLLKIDLIRSRHLAQTAGLHYRYAMSCYLQGEWEQTEMHLRQAIEQSPNDPSFRLALATFYRERGRYHEAAREVQRLLEIDSEHPGYRNLAREIDQALKEDRATGDDP